jgi:transcriptional regulator with XRE-family HTH domain
VGPNIARLRGKSGLTQAQLSARVGVSLRTIQNWEYGHFLPKWDQLTALARILDCTVADFFVPVEDEHEPEPNGDETVAA